MAFQMYQVINDVLVGELCKVAKSEAESFDENIKATEELKLEAIMLLTTEEKVEQIDMTIDALSGMIKNHKINQQFWLAISKRNWKLLTPIRKKYRESCDALMEMGDELVGKGYLPESKYIQNADDFKENLGNMDAVLSRCEKAFGLVL
jgi:hypothetical protein